MATVLSPTGCKNADLERLAAILGAGGQEGALRSRTSSRWWRIAPSSSTSAGMRDLRIEGAQLLRVAENREQVAQRGAPHLQETPTRRTNGGWQWPIRRQTVSFLLALQQRVSTLGDCHPGLQARTAGSLAAAESQASGSRHVTHAVARSCCRSCRGPRCRLPAASVTTRVDNTMCQQDCREPRSAMPRA